MTVVANKAKHVAIKHIRMSHLPTKDMTSDRLTKALVPTPSLNLRTKLLGIYSYISNIWTLLL